MTFALKLLYFTLALFFSLRISVVTSTSVQAGAQVCKSTSTTQTGCPPCGTSTYSYTAYSCPPCATTPASSYGNTLNLGAGYWCDSQPGWSQTGCGFSDGGNSCSGVESCYDGWSDGRCYATCYVPARCNAPCTQTASQCNSPCSTSTTTCNILPDAPTLIDPVNSGAAISQVTFVWSGNDPDNSPNSREDYQIAIRSQDGTYSTIVGFGAGLTGTSGQPVSYVFAPRRTGTFYWKVRAWDGWTDGSGQPVYSDYSPERSIYIDYNCN